MMEIDEVIATVSEIRTSIHNSQSDLDCSLLAGTTGFVQGLTLFNTSSFRCSKVKCVEDILLPIFNAPLYHFLKPIMTGVFS